MAQTVLRLGSGISDMKWRILSEHSILLTLFKKS